MDSIPGGALAPSEAELAALEALLDQDEVLVSGLVDVAELIERLYLEDGESVPAAVAAELSAVRRWGGVPAAARRAALRTARRVERARLAWLRERHGAEIASEIAAVAGFGWVA